MPMPQRKPKPQQQQQFPSNNSNVNVNANSLLIAGAVGAGSGSSNNGRRSPYYANSYHRGGAGFHVHPHHHAQAHHSMLAMGMGMGLGMGLPPPPPPPPPPQPPPTQPPLITDTLTACLDVNGTYVCTSYSPRCYIIQKVTPTSVTVTPTQPLLSVGPPPPPPPPPPNFALFGGPNANPHRTVDFFGFPHQHQQHVHAHTRSKFPAYQHHQHANHMHTHHGHASTCTHHQHQQQPAPSQSQDSTSTSISAKSTTTSSLTKQANAEKDYLLKIASKAPKIVEIERLRVDADTNTDAEPPAGEDNEHEQDPDRLSVVDVDGDQDQISETSSCNKEEDPAKAEMEAEAEADAELEAGADTELKSRPTPEGAAAAADRKNPKSTEAPDSGCSYMNGEVESSGSHGEDVQIAAAQCGGDAINKPDTRLLNGVVSDGCSVPEEPMALNSDGEQPVTATAQQEKERAGQNQSQTSPPNANANNDQPLAMMNGEEQQIPSDTPIDELRQLLLTQLEYYFSAENLSNDKFLVSQMDSDQYVYISTIANFNMIKKLSSDLDLITDVLKESKLVQVHSDGKRIRPVSNRTVVILRGIPESTPIEEIKALFEKENSPKCNNCEFAFNDSWYLSFDNDDEAVRAHRYLREDVCEFKGHPIMARIKSRPTTLLAQGVGVNPVKNGYNPPPQPTIPQYMNVPYVSSVSGNQPGPTAVAAPIFTGQQMAPAVFTIPTGPYASFGTQVPWAGYYDINSAAIFSINGLQQPTSQPAPNYNNKGTGMAPRNRNTKSETDNYYRMPRGPNNRRGESSSSAGGAGFPPHQNQYGGGGGGAQHRKNSGPQPQPLLGMPPLPLNSHHTPSHSHNHSHHGHGLVGAGASSNMSRANSVHYNNSSLSSHNVPQHVSESYHYSNTNSSRYQRGNDNRPRSSLGTRKPPRSYEDDANYEQHNHNSSAPVVSVSGASRGNPSTTRQVPSTPVSPQPPASSSSTSQSHSHGHRVNSPQNPQAGSGAKTNFDLESNAFPPLPGAGAVNTNASVKNGDRDSAYEGRLSDVVKGVKNVKVSQTGEREDAATNTAMTELVVSAQDNSRESTYVVSAASPTKDLDSPKEFSSQSNAPEHKKEFREVGVGSADDSRASIRAATYREPAAPVVKSKETADKSTRTDTALLHGDSGSRQPGAAKSGAAAGDAAGGAENYRKSVPQSTKSPIFSKRGVPGGGAPPHTSSVAVGSEVPYSPPQSRKDSSPAKPPTSGHVDSDRRDRSGSASYVAKIQGDNNSRTGSSNVNCSNHGRSNFNTSDNDAFPTPGAVKSNVPMNKAAAGGAGVNDLSAKGAGRTEEKASLSRKVSVGVGDENICSNDDSAVAARLKLQAAATPAPLSYAQVAMASRKDKVSQSSSAVQLPQPSSSSSSTVSQPAAGASSEDRKKPMSMTLADGSNARDSRPLSKANFQRGNSNGSDSSDRGSGRGGPGAGPPGGYRRFRSRISSEASDGSGTGGGGSTNFGGRPPRRNRSPR